MPPRTPGRLRTDPVAAAWALLERAGSPEGVTLRAVAREAGVTAPAVDSHFADLQALLDASWTTGSPSCGRRSPRRWPPVPTPSTGCTPAAGPTWPPPGRPARDRAVFGPRRAPGGEVAFDVLVDVVATCVPARCSASPDPDGRLQTLAVRPARLTGISDESA